ncbi:hypothetical protein Tco_1232499 [Tanacetum coccineum]
MEHDQLFTEFNVRAARQMSLCVEVRMRAEYNVKERRRLKSVVEKQDELLKVREGEIENLKAQLLLREAEAAEAIRLRAEASNFGAIEKSLRYETNALRECNVILEKEWNALDVKVTELEALAASKGRELTDLNAQLTSVKSQNDNLVDRVHELEVSSAGLQEKVTVYENCTEQLEKFQDDQMKVINDKFDKLYTDFGSSLGGERLLVRLLRKACKMDYLLESPMARKLRSNKDASTNTLVNILRLEETLAERLGLTESQTHVDQLMVPIHHSPDKVVIGATALSLALDVSSIRVRKIRENIANQRSALRDMFVPLAEPFSAVVLIGAEGTSDTVAATADTTMTLSTTFASASTIAPIFIDDYEAAGTDDQAAAAENAEPFPNVDDAELNIPQ